MNTPFHSNDGTPLYNAASVRARLGQRDEGRNFWRNLEELADDPSFGEWLEHEFPRQFWDGAPQLNRRRFLQLLGGSLALAGLAGCAHQPQTQIAPYVNQPENVVPGIPIHFASALTIGGWARGVLVESDEGRPVKIEGNPTHPASLGATDAVTQGLLWNLYDPDRAREVRFRGEPSSWDALESALNEVRQQHGANKGAGLRILTETVTSPTLGAQMAQLQTRFPQMQWHQYDPINRDNARAGANFAFGRDVAARYHFERAAVVVSLDDDFLLHGPASVRYARDFMAGRRASTANPTMNRLYAVEGAPTLTGAMADHRLALAPSQIEGAARALAAQLGVGAAAAALPPATTQWLKALVGDLKKARGRSLIVAGERQSPAVHALAHAINAALGNVGKTVEYLAPIEVNSTDHGESLRALAGEMNAGQVQTLLILGANPSFNAPFDVPFSQGLLKVPLSFRLGTHHDETAQLCTWSLPQAHELESWGDARAFDGTTSIVQPLIAPLYEARSAHEIVSVLQGQIGRGGYDIVREFWQNQNGRAIAATQTTQPAISSVNGGAVNFGATNPNLTRAPAAPAANVNAPHAPLPRAIAPTPTPPYDPRIDDAASNRRGTNGAAPDAIPNRNASGAMQPNVAAPDLGAIGIGPNPQATAPKAERPAPTAAPNGDFEAFWRAALHDGLIPNSAEKPLALVLQPDLAARLPAPAAAAQSGLELEFRFDPYLLDGRYGNNAWLHELPRPLTTLTWDNAIWISPATAERLQLTNEDVIELTVGQRTLGGPVWMVPGMPDDTLSVQLGFGRVAAGAVGDNVGFNAYAIRRWEAPFWEGGAKLQKLGVTQPLAQTQKHHNMEGRDLVIEGTLRQFAQTPTFARAQPDNDPAHPRASLYPEYAYPGHKWGMSIDLNSCIGCNACTIACQAENNIPVVGAEEVRRGREMHWIRVDTYFQGAPSEPRILFQPVPCMHCENAPCEPVCPVGATLHSSEGLNMQVYNRCVGTRYCSNNCPYKVRRFNFLSYTDYSDKPSLKILQNPEVSVRNRGVMEKCTYCIQRIQHAEIAEQKANQPMQDGAVVTACQQVCPTQAITFGDINLPGSAVAKAKAESLNYGILLELNTQPRTTYSARLTNPNEEVKA